jgi:hypothetical protein
MGLGTWQVWVAGEVHTGFWWGNLRERDNLEDLGVDESVILKLVFQDKGWMCRLNSSGSG